MENSDQSVKNPWKFWRILKISEASLLHMACDFYTKLRETYYTRKDLSQSQPRVDSYLGGLKD